MLFTEARFLLFFLVAFTVYWALPRDRLRRWWLLIGSYVFYGAWDWRFTLLMFGSTLLDYLVARGLGASGSPRTRKALITISVAGQLGALALFKYFDFFAASLTELLTGLGVSVNVPLLHLILPIGISFYTFQTLSYTIDVYRRDLQPVRNFVDLAFFVAFFPQLLAGPITRAHDFLPQLERRRLWSDVNVRVCLTLFLIGYVKKACLSDNLAPATDRVFADPSACTTGELWIGALLYALRMYCDFSGYSDMALATAGLFGYRLMLNFDFPWVAGTLTEFWRRWHISMSTWFRDYLYVPLCGTSKGAVRTAASVVALFFLGGLWHGPNWTFVVWGLYHGCFLVAERMLGWNREGRVPRAIGIFYTVFVVLMSFVIFRSPTLGSAGRFFAGLFTPHAGGGVPVFDHAWALVLPAFAIGHVLAYRRVFARWWHALPTWQFSIAYGAAVALMLPWVASDYLAFIYFQF